MNTATTILGILQILTSLGLIALVILQKGRNASISGAISGGSETFFSKSKSKTRDAFLAKLTPYVAVLFFALTVVILFASRS